MRSLSFGLLLLVGGGAFGAPPSSPIWLWTPAERVSMRVEHFAVPRAAPRVQSLSVGTGGERLVIDGRTNPELLMPNELVNALLQGLSDDAQVRAVNRQSLASGIRAFGFDEEEFWRRLDQATSTYREQVRGRSRAEWSQTRVSRSQGALDGLDRSLCGSRAKTMDSLRLVFRKEGFDRFLYTVVAPTISITTAAGYENPEHLLSVERGCQ